MPLKTYVLLSSLDADAPVFKQTADGQRIQVKKMPVFRPYLRVAYQDEKGIGRVIRYKSNAVLTEGDKERVIIDQREQIDKLKLDANEEFTRTERRDLEFKHGILVTNKLAAQTYLEAYPGFEGFKGTCEDVRDAQFKLLDEVAEAKLKNSDIRLRVKAANKVIEMGLEEAQDTLIRLNGSFFTTPTDVEECQNLLMNFIDDAEEAGLKAVLQDASSTNIDEQTTVLIGKLINQGTLSFNATEGKISKKDLNGEWIDIRDMSAEYSLEERKRLFSDFLNSNDGKLLKNDLEKDLKISDEGTEEKKRMGRPPKN